MTPMVSHEVVVWTDVASAISDMLAAAASTSAPIDVAAMDAVSGT